MVISRNGVPEILKSKILSISFPILAASLSGVLLFLAFPDYELWWLGWVALVPLLVALNGRSTKHAFLLSCLCGVVFFTGVFGWIFEIPKFGFVHYATISPYTALYFALFGLSFSLILNRLGVAWACAAAPFIWTSLEYIRSNASFLSLPWALLAHSQYQNPIVIQIASVTGAYGVSFLIVLVNAAIALLFSSVAHPLVSGKAPVSRMARTLFTGFTACLVGTTLVYGHLAISKPISGKEVKATVIQGNISRTMKANPMRYAEFIMGKYIRLTREAPTDEAELVLWPEAATPGFVLKHLTLRKQMISLVREVRRYFLIGSSEYPKFIKDREFKRGEAGNTALFFSPGGKVLGQYLKIHLVPFGEYVPLEGVVSWPSFIVLEDKRNFEVPGTQYTLFRMDGARFGVVICWEIVFPRLFSEFVKRGANFMVNLTNEGWFGETAAPYQMLSMSVFRSVENRIATVRAANTGISCFIDPLGRVTARVENNGKEIFVEGYLTRAIPLSQEQTFYTQHGDTFVYFAFLAAVGLVLLALSARKRSVPKRQDERGIS
jgi:apolipoprotein N-acyltransferase